MWGICDDFLRLHDCPLETPQGWLPRGLSSLVFSIESDLDCFLPGTLVYVWSHSDYHTWEVATLLWWVEVRNIVKQLTKVQDRRVKHSVKVLKLRNPCSMLTLGFLTLGVEPQLYLHGCPHSVILLGILAIWRDHMLISFSRRLSSPSFLSLHVSQLGTKMGCHMIEEMESGRGHLAHPGRVRKSSFSEWGLEGLVGLSWEMKRWKARESSNWEQRLAWFCSLVYP